MTIGRRAFLFGAAGAAATAALAQGKAQTNSRSQHSPFPPLVFLPGIKGSELRDAQGQIRWVTLAEAFGLSSPNLALPLQWDDGHQARDGFVATAPLGTVAWHNVYAPFLDWAAASRPVFQAFPYDWRRNNLESSDQLIAVLEKVRAENAGARVQVVAHSMGGLIAYAALVRRPELFHSILFAGVPFGNSVSFLEDMHAGTSNGLNKRILDPGVLFTFGSPYSFFPIDPSDSQLLDVDGKPIVHNWYSADDWARQKLGIFAGGDSPGLTREQNEHLHQALDRARHFKSLLSYNDSISYPAIAVLAGDRFPTLRSAVRNGPHSVKGWDFVTAAKPSGDGRVYFQGALPPAGVPHALFKSSREHGDLVNDTAQVASILARLPSP